MGTATSRPAALGLAALALAITGCGGTGSGKPSASASGGSPATTTGQPPPAGGGAGLRDGFAWLRPRAAPSGWRSVTVATGAVMPYPPGWHQIHGDAGTATAVLQDHHAEFLGYLNLTPRQGTESLTNWASFRVAHNADDGDRHVNSLGAATRLRFRSGTGSCVRDAYATTTGARFIEIACLVTGSRASSVIVGAAPPQAWAQVSPSIERAISAFTT